MPTANRMIQHEVFEQFGADPFMPHLPSPTERIEGKRRSILRGKVRDHVPKQPGVYGMLDAVGRLIYVGKSKSLKGRILSYFMPTNEDEKSGRIIRAAKSIVWETHPSEFAALLREHALIRTFQPRFNVQGMPNRKKAGFLCLGHEPAERFYVANQPEPSMRAWEGPLFGTGRLRRAAEILNRVFRLRDCSNRTKFVFSDQLSLFSREEKAHCIRFEIASCLGPCIASCSRRAYASQVVAAKNFLSGETDGILDELEQHMKAAAYRRHFEHAIRLREDLKVMRWLVRRLREHASARQHLTCIYPVVGEDARDIWYLIRRGVVEHAVPAPADARSNGKYRRIVEEWLHSEKNIGRRYARREENLAIVSFWFRSHPEERKRLIYFDSSFQKFVRHRTKSIDHRPSDVLE